MIVTGRFPKRAALVLAAALSAALAPQAMAQQFRLGPLVIDQPWTRATPHGATIAGGYLTITNTGSTPDRLVGGSLTNAGGFEIHEMKVEDGVMKMRALPNGLEIKPGETVAFKPGGFHLMFTELKQPLKQGEVLRGRLTFEKAGTVDVEYKVEPIGAQRAKSHDHTH
ncbi:MAG: copper chaperone PCu(A)C [Variibacter sp.]|nr:copper chaperone PCu(A)C [Variibacter sp.]